MSVGKSGRDRRSETGRGKKLVRDGEENIYKDREKDIKETGGRDWER
jgi:hypothetical protein